MISIFARMFDGTLQRFDAGELSHDQAIKAVDEDLVGRAPRSPVLALIEPDPFVIEPSAA